MYGLSKLSKRCSECRFVDTCDHKKMEALAVMNPPITVNLSAPVLRENVAIELPWGEGQQVTVYKDEISEKIRKTLYSDFKMSYRE